MNNQRNLHTGAEWLVTGVIVHEGIVNMVAVNPWALVMDVRAWIEAQADAHERDAKTATTASGRAMMENIALTLRRFLEGDTKIVNSPLALVKCSVPVFQRVQIGFLQVIPENFDAYIWVVVGSARGATLSAAPSFLLVADSKPPRLLVTPEASHLKKFAPKWVTGRVVSKGELRREFDVIAQQYPHSREQNAAPRPTLAQKRQLHPDASNLLRQREALLATARFAGIALGLSDVFAMDLDALEARLATDPAWREDSIQKFLQAAKHAAQPKPMPLLSPEVFG